MAASTKRRPGARWTVRADPCGPTPGATTTSWSTAARKVFADQGGGASMEAIAKQAGVGVGTLYRHFPKRIDVVEAVYRDDVDALVGAATVVSASWSRGTPWRPGSRLRGLRAGEAGVPQRAARGF